MLFVGFEMGLKVKIGATKSRTFARLFLFYF